MYCSDDDAVDSLKTKHFSQVTKIDALRKAVVAFDACERLVSYLRIDRIAIIEGFAEFTIGCVEIGSVEICERALQACDAVLGVRREMSRVSRLQGKKKLAYLMPEQLIPKRQLLRSTPIL